MPSSEASDLSDLNSADFQHSERGEDTEHDDTDNTLKPPPIKKRRLNKPGPSPLGTPSTTIGPSAPIIDDGDVSSDTSGSCPPSPRAFKDPSISTDERAAANEHVHICQWAGCMSGDLEDQDALVEHINNVHIPESKDDKYACDWGDCRSKTKPQGSAYALRAHMRSHTKEKPFYCALPECDRCFTRSDALTKHMKTVHENEGPRTVEHYVRPAPRTSVTATNTPNPEQTAPAVPTGDKPGEPLQAPPKPPSKIKLIMNGKGKSSPSTPSSSDFLDDVATGPLTPLSPGTRDETFGRFPPDFEFDEHETSLDRRQLFRLLRRQIHWAEQEGKDLHGETAELEKDRRKEWMAKELVMENLLEAEYANADKFGVFDVDGADFTFGEPTEAQAWNERLFGGAGAEATEKERQRILASLEGDALTAAKLPVDGHSELWYRLESALEERKRKSEARGKRAINGTGRKRFDGGHQDAVMMDGDETEDEELL